MLEHLRAVIWPRGKQLQSGNKPEVYRYVVIGLLVTDEPIEGIEGKNEIVLDGRSWGLCDVLKSLPQKKSRIKLGDANMVLTSLDIIVDDDE